MGGDGGATYDGFYFFPDGDYSTPTAALFYPLTDEYMMSFGGDVETLEVGLTDWLSLGTRLGLLSFCVSGFRDGYWKLQASIFTRAQLLDLPKLKIHASAEGWASPIFSVPRSNWMGDGLLNIFGTVSFNFPVIS